MTVLYLCQTFFRKKKDLLQKFIFHRKSFLCFMLYEDESIRNSEIAFPDLSKYDNLETFQYLGTEADQVYGDLWNKVKSS